MNVNRSVVRLFDEPIECLLNHGSVGIFGSGLKCRLLGITDTIQDIFLGSLWITSILFILF